MSFDPVDLTDIKCQLAMPGMADYSTLQVPEHGGPIFKVDRLGGGFRIEFHLPPENVEPEGRRLIARFQKAKRFGAVIEYPQVDFRVGAPGDPTVDGGIAGGMMMPVTGGLPKYAVRQGQALNVVKASRSYLYFADAQTILDASGAGELALTTPLRTQLAGGEGVNLRRPIMEGWILGDNFDWPIDRIRMVGLSFTLQERA